MSFVIQKEKASNAKIGKHINKSVYFSWTVFPFKLHNAVLVDVKLVPNVFWESPSYNLLDCRWLCIDRSHLLVIIKQV